MYVGMYAMPWHGMWASENNLQFSSSTIWVLGMDCRPLGLAASLHALSHPTGLVAELKSGVRFVQSTGIVQSREMKI